MGCYRRSARRGSKPGFAFKELFRQLDRSSNESSTSAKRWLQEAPTNELLKTFLLCGKFKPDNALIEEIRQSFGLKQGFSAGRRLTGSGNRCTV